jgi:hypothetical protein
MKSLLTYLCIIFCGCSSAHQISFSLPAIKSAAVKQPFIIEIYASDSVKDYTYNATLSGGLCKGHDFELKFGKGILKAIEQGFGSFYDSVIIISSPKDASATPEGKIRYIVTPEIQHIIANADFSNAAFAVKIDAKIEQDIFIHVNNLDGTQVMSASIHAIGEYGGKGEDCHSAVPYLKKAGEMALLNLRDSIINRLSSDGLAK